MHLAEYRAPGGQRSWIGVRIHGRLALRWYEQTMVFTQYGDTMEYLREELRKDPELRMR